MALLYCRAGFATDSLLIYTMSIIDQILRVFYRLINRIYGGGRATLLTPLLVLTPCYARGDTKVILFFQLKAVVIQERRAMAARMA